PALPVFVLAACIAGLIVVVRALIVPGVVPSGREVVYEDAPARFEAIDDVVQRMSYHKKNGVFAAWIESVTLDGSFDAKVHQVPRAGVFGNFENRLQLGSPRHAALTIAELKAILAHEVGHLGGEHGRFVAWLYRQRVAWALVQQKPAQPTNAIDRVLGKFYGWYAAYFQAYAFVLARELEYKADRAASRATHPGAVANALT